MPKYYFKQTLYHFSLKSSKISQKSKKNHLRKRNLKKKHFEPLRSCQVVRDVYLRGRLYIKRVISENLFY
jgi:hypothetical protein